MFWNRKKYKIKKDLKYLLPGLISNYALNQKGIIFAIISSIIDGKKQKNLYGISINKGILWRNNINLPFINELRIDNQGFAWISFYNQLAKIDETGNVVNIIKLKLDKKQKINSFVILNDGFIISINTDYYCKPNAKIIKVNIKGDLLWETKIIPKKVSYSGVVSVSAANNWEKEELEPWEPRDWLTGDILVLNNKSLIKFWSPSSGIGICYCLNIKTGEIQWQTKPGPFNDIACLENKFIIGCQGYGAFNTDLYDENGQIIDKWASVGRYIISKNNEIFVLESSNYSGDSLHLSKLLSDGQVKKLVNISSDYYPYPLIDESNNIVFSFNRKITIIDEKLKKHELFNYKIYQEDLSEKILLFNKGMLIWNIGSILFIAQTNLGKLAQSPWPCLFSNLQGNPVINEK
jgi:hypothetical protein